MPVDQECKQFVLLTSWMLNKRAKCHQLIRNTKLLSISSNELCQICHFANINHNILYLLGDMLHRIILIKISNVIDIICAVIDTYCAVPTNKSDSFAYNANIMTKQIFHDYLPSFVWPVL